MCGPEGLGFIEHPFERNELASVDFRALDELAARQLLGMLCQVVLRPSFRQFEQNVKARFINVACTISSALELP